MTNLFEQKLTELNQKITEEKALRVEIRRLKEELIVKMDNNSLTTISCGDLYAKFVGPFTTINWNLKELNELIKHEPQNSISAYKNKTKTTNRYIKVGKK